MSAIPTFQITGGVPVSLALTFDCLATYTIALCDWNGTKWVPRTPYVEEDGVSHGSNPTTYSLGNVNAGQTVLVVLPVEMTSPGGDSSVTTTATVSQGGATKGQLGTPPTQPGPNQAA